MIAEASCFLSSVPDLEGAGVHSAASQLKQPRPDARRANGGSRERNEDYVVIRRRIMPSPKRPPANSSTDAGSDTLVATTSWRTDEFPEISRTPTKAVVVEVRSTGRASGKPVTVVKSDKEARLAPV